LILSSRPIKSSAGQLACSLHIWPCPLVATPGVLSTQREGEREIHLNHFTTIQSYTSPRLSRSSTALCLLNSESRHRFTRHSLIATASRSLWVPGLLVHSLIRSLRSRRTRPAPRPDERTYPPVPADAITGIPTAIGALSADTSDAFVLDHNSLVCPIGLCSPTAFFGPQGVDPDVHDASAAALRSLRSWNFLADQRSFISLYAR
jgi:hypothetical protein